MSKQQSLVIAFFILVMMFMTSCNGGGAGGKSQALGSIPNSTITLKFESLGVWRSTGQDDVPAEVDVNRNITIPSTITVTQDTDGTIVNGDTATIVFVNDTCSYSYDGSVFNFVSCDGDLSSFRDGDTITLKSIEEPAFPTLNTKVKIGLIRPSNNKHTGFVTMVSNL